MQKVNEEQRHKCTRCEGKNRRMRLDISKRPWRCFFSFFATPYIYDCLREKWRSMSNILCKCHFHSSSHRDLHDTWSLMGERLHRGCPVNRPRRLREETRPEPIVSAGSQTHRHGPSSDKDCLVGSACNQSAGTILQIFLNGASESGIFARVGRTSIFLFSSPFTCSSHSSSPVPPLHFSLSSHGFFPFLPRPVHLRLLFERRCSISWWSVMRITRLSRWCARWVFYRWYTIIIMIFCDVKKSVEFDFSSPRVHTTEDESCWLSRCN